MTGTGTGAGTTAVADRGAGARLRTKIELAKPAADRASAALWTGPHAREAYLLWLEKLHGMIRATVPLMLTALDACLARGPGDEVAATFGRYLARHVHEEYGHDVWVEEDHARATGGGAPLADRVPDCDVAEMVGAQYYWIRHAHPVALAGHIAVLEGYPPDEQLAAGLARRTGFPLDAFETIARHATLDQKHRDDLYRMYGRLPLTPAQEDLVGLSALHTVRGLVQVLADVRERAAAQATAAQATAAQAPARAAGA